MRNMVHKENCCIPCVLALFNWLWGLPPKHAYHSQQTEETVTHAFVSAHVHHSLSFHSPPLSFWIHFYYHRRFQNKQTSIHQLVLSACALCEPFCLLENTSALTTWQRRTSTLELRSLPMPKVQNITVIVKPGKASALFLKLNESFAAMMGGFQAVLPAPVRLSYFNAECLPQAQLKAVFCRQRCSRSSLTLLFPAVCLSPLHMHSFWRRLLNVNHPHTELCKSTKLRMHDWGRDLATFPVCTAGRSISNF